MQRLIPVKAPTSIPRVPPTHRDKRRRESGPTPTETDWKPKQDEDIPETRDNDDQTIDEYA
ncbi:MAG: hypothetical protein OER80_01880 [Gammaproteobacteria bacterium]|nr:hypothetical protein [Gammaproteobacteria bacterium]MDH3767984.1 hypothetical protein [Gammaproteobacteria bacterium]